jgi:hypothetical protein
MGLEQNKVVLYWDIYFTREAERYPELAGN